MGKHLFSFFAAFTAAMVLFFNSPASAQPSPSTTATASASTAASAAPSATADADAGVPAQDAGAQAQATQPDPNAKPATTATPAQSTPPPVACTKEQVDCIMGAMPKPKPLPPIKVVCGVGTTGEVDKKTGRCECPEGLVMVPGLPLKGKRTDKCVPSLQLYDELAEELAELAKLRQSADAELKAEIDRLVARIDAELIRIDVDLDNKANVESVGRLLGEILGLMIRLTRVEDGLDDVWDELEENSLEGLMGATVELNLPGEPAGKGLNGYLAGGLVLPGTRHVGMLFEGKLGISNHNSVGTVAVGGLGAGPYIGFDDQGNHRLALLLAGIQQWDPSETDADRRFPGYRVGPEVKYMGCLSQTPLCGDVAFGLGFGAESGIDVRSGDPFYGDAVTPYASFGMKWRSGHHEKK